MDGKIIKIKIYQPRLWTKELHESNKRWKVVVAHRRSGKTTATLNHLIRDAVNINNSRFAFIAPTYKQAKNIAWDILKEYARKIDGAVFNESELRADFANGSRITLYGSDNPDALRGMALWGVVFDEYSQQPSNIFSEIIRPALVDHNGYAIWIGTPKGKNDFYELYQRARINEHQLAILLTVEDTGLINAEELEDAKKAMTEDEYKQEFFSSFEASIKGAYYSKELEFARKEKRITTVPYEPEKLVYTFWDLGISDTTTIGFFQIVGKENRMIDYYENNGEALSHYVKVLKEKPYVYEKHSFPHDIEVRELGTGKSRKEVLESLGIKVNVVAKLSIQDGINAGRLIFSSLWIDKIKCECFLNALGQYRQEWDDSKGMFRDKPLHNFASHPADMFRYFAIGISKFKTAKNDFQNKPNSYI